MSRITRNGLGWLFVASLCGGVAAPAGPAFTIADPPVDFEVIDADDGSGEYFFDGIGDFVFPTFNDVALGSFGEGRSMAEFDLLPFTVPSGEFISSALFDVKITSVGVFGLGIDGEVPASVGVDGYVGNGLEEESDFQAGNGNHLYSVPLMDPNVGDVLSFNVTSYVTTIVNAHQRYVGLTVRAETFGGMMFEERNGYPKLTIETAPFAKGDLNCDGVIDNFDINPFVLAMTNPTGYQATYPNCNRMNADCNNDGVVDNFDINPFVALLVGK